ncbi:unnamed protein product, partial [Ostreobium quekettii]
VRPVPLEFDIHGFEISNFEARMQAMSRPCYSNIIMYGGEDKPAIVYVPTRKHARLTTLDLLMYAAADGQPSQFLQCKEDDLAPYLSGVREAALKHSLSYGVGFLHESMSQVEKDTVLHLFAIGATRVLVATASLCWSIHVNCHLVVIMGTQHFDGTGTGGTDYPVTDLLQMMGRASRPLKDQSGRCVLMCHGPRKEYYKKFLFEPFPVESHLDIFLHDHFVAEIVTRTIENKQDAVDYLTWTFFYRRLAQNPNYYHLQGVSHRHLSDHLSDLVENTLSELEQSRVISIEDGMDLSALNLGMIASYYYIKYTTIELFSSSLTAKTKLKGLLEILSAASEYDDLPLRPGEDDAVRKLLMHAPVAVDRPKYTDPHVKANALLQAHFSRTHVSADLALDQRGILVSAMGLIQSMVDVIGSNSWLSPALVAMEMSQMVTQGLWERDPVLMQVPHCSRDVCKRCSEQGVESVFELIEMADKDRRDLLAMSDAQLHDVTLFCNRYPDIQLNYQLVNTQPVAAGDQVTIRVNLEREQDGEVGSVDAPRYPKRKDEAWWLAIGDAKANQLLAIKRVNLQRKANVRLDFAAPGEPGAYNLTLYFMCDSYMGCDQEYEFDLDVGEADDEDMVDASD